MQLRKPSVIALMGPTASGKTELALSLARRLNGEIISVDSALVYRGMDIGTAKPSAAERAQVPHHLIDICDPAELYSAANFRCDAHDCIQAILARGRIPLLVGGTMLYFKALLEGLSPMPASDPIVRAAIESEAAQYGWPALHRELNAIDPITAERLHPNHSQRIGRALEVFRISGKPMSEWQGRNDGGIQAQYNCVQIALAPQRREILHQRIAERFERMLQLNFVEEVRYFYCRGDLHQNLPSMRAVGYRQVWQHLVGRLSYDEMREQGVAATRQLAKRQLTWLRNWHDLNWVYSSDRLGNSVPFDEILKEVLNIEGIRTI